MERVSKGLNSLKSRKGMTLVEVLVALTLLALIAVTFMPLFSQYYRNVKRAGDVSQKTYLKSSRMERLIANKGKNANYETLVGNVPITFTANGKSMEFSTAKSTLDGVIIMDDYINTDAGTYSMYYGQVSGTKLACFPNTISDDFVQKTIYVVIVGGEFDKPGEPKDTWELYVNQGTVDDDGSVIDSNDVKLSKGVHYSFDQVKNSDLIQAETDKKLGVEKYTIAKITLFGANDKVCFENSPLKIKCNSTVLPVLITAPEIIMVGEGTSGATEGAGSASNRFYYATAGLDENNEIVILAKTMKDAPLTTAMNDVEWVQPGMGSDSVGGKNEYGYYIMGGDAGQVRRFWNRRDDAKGGFYWGGDDIVLYSKGYVVQPTTYTTASTMKANSWEGSYDSVNKTTSMPTGYHNNQINFVRSTEATSSTFFTTTYTPSLNIATNLTRTFANMYYNYPSASSSSRTLIENNNAFLFVNKDSLVGGYRFALMTPAYSTVSLDAKRENFDLAKYSTVHYLEGNSSDTKNNDKIASGANDKKALVENMTVEGYKSSTGYSYNNTVTITSVGAIPISSEGLAKATGIQTGDSLNLYPTRSYDLYCGYIPAVVNVVGGKYSEKDMNNWTYQAALGVKVSGGKFYPTAKFGDSRTSGWMANLNWSGVAGDEQSATAGNPNILATLRNAYYITAGKEVDITIGYTSYPYAISVLNPARSADLLGSSGLLDFSPTGSDYIFCTASAGTGAVGGKNADNNELAGEQYDHTFIGSGLRDFVTLLDVKSWHDEIRDKNFSIAGGYTVSLMGNDVDSWTRMGMVMNTGMVFLRGTGDGENNDTVGSFESGKGWSLGTESNVFHEFYSTYQYSKCDGISVMCVGARGWDTRYHKTYHNISTTSYYSPSDDYYKYGGFLGIGQKKGYLSPSPTRFAKGFEGGKNTHPMEFCEVSCVNKGNSAVGDIQLMWGTTNGTLLSWTYVTEVNNQNGGGWFTRATNESKITSVTKEFESYIWISRWNNTENLNGGNTNVLSNSYVPMPENAGYSNNRVTISNYQSAFYDYYSVKQGNGNGGNYGFISVLDTVNDVCYGDGIWIAVGNCSNAKPEDYCGNAAYSGGGVGTYVNVRYESNGNYYWKAVKVSNAKINMESVTFCNGVWYISGTNTANNEGVFMYSVNPFGTWTPITTAYYYNGTSTPQSVAMSKINSMASQEG